MPCENEDNKFYASEKNSVSLPNVPLEGEAINKGRKFKLAFVYSKAYCLNTSGYILTHLAVVVVIQFLSDVVPSAKMAGFIPFCNCLHSFSPLVSIRGILPLQTDFLCLLLHLLLPGFLRSSSLSLAI